MTSAADCPLRSNVVRRETEETAACGFLSAAFACGDERLVRVGRAACDACCTAAATYYNPVLASLVYRRAHDQLAERPAGPDADRFARLKEEAQHRLLLTSPRVNRAPGALGVIGRGARRLLQTAPRDTPLSWAVAILTAPRTPPTLFATLHSLSGAGFEAPHIFAEPDSAIPECFSHLPLFRHRRRQGPLGNFCIAAQTLLDTHPEADCFAIFEDDLSAAEGLRNWCDGEFWPGGHGIVSLYTSRVFCDDRPGWQTLNLGRYRTFGALAFVFCSRLLRELLADIDVRRHACEGNLGADAVVGEWALKRGIGIAYHTPSLIQHEGRATALTGHEVGRVGASLAVRQAEAVRSWRPPEQRLGRVGLIGWNTCTGLGYQNRDIALHLPAARWLAPPHPHFPSLPRPRMSGSYWMPSSRRIPLGELRAWLKGLSWILFVEQPYLHGIVPVAREMGISVACVPNWEWLATGLSWLPYVDLMICPTQFTYRMLAEWRQNLGFAWDVVHVPWPIDPSRFPYRRRERCEAFLFVNGTGGGRARYADGSQTAFRRKGLELIAATARLTKTAPWIVYSQEDDLPRLPSNVEVRTALRDNRDLYADGDVCVQPSHWEGLGLQLLECQAAGLPLVTTDAPPMNEHRPYRGVLPSATESVLVYADQAVDAQLVRPEVLAEALLQIHGADLRQASEQARAFIEQERSWPCLRTLLAKWLVE